MTSSRGRFKRYEKFGNKNTAMEEFYSLQPREVKRYKRPKMIIGLIGDRQIKMYNDLEGNPVIEIIDNNAKKIFEKWNQPGTYGEKIVYKQ